MHRLHAVAAVPFVTVVLVLAGALPAAAAPGGTLDPTFGNAGASVAAGFDLGRAVVTSGPRSYVAARRKTPSGFGVVALGADGQVDTTFGTAGAVVLPDPPGSGQLDLAPAPGGGVYASRTTSNTLRVTRLGPTGAADPSFGTGGTFALPLFLGDFSVFWYEVRADATGALTFVGVASEIFTRLLVIARVTPTGTLDASFGTGGLGGLALDPNQFEFPSDLVVDPLGRVLVVLESGDMLRASFVLRFTAAGAIDPTFGVAGIAVPTKALHAIDAALDSQGRIVLLGVLYFATFLGQSTPVLARLAPDGTPDLTFGTGGVTNLRPSDGLRNWPGALQVDHLDRAVFTFSVSTGFGGTVLAGVVRADATGALDPTFGFGAGAGVAAWPLPTSFTDLTVDTTDRIVVVGDLPDAASPTCPPDCSNVFALRLRAA